jgi:hypothetical protein
MHNEAQIILQQVFNKRSLNDVSISELKQLTEEYPYFNAAQFLLAKKIRMEKAEIEGKKHPALFFSNPLWYSYLLKQDFPVTEEVVEDELVIETKSLTGETVSVESEQKEAVEAGKPAIEAPLEFEPFHTIDYFASQGIKLQQADLSKDKFGQQLKSFTEWLKSMKRLPAPTPENVQDNKVQAEVAQAAEESIETKEVVTEAMAEVWALQGNKQKAREIYKKLSLLNPAKSAYFASKIEQLNS